MVRAPELVSVAAALLPTPEAVAVWLMPYCTLADARATVVPTALAWAAIVIVPLLVRLTDAAPPVAAYACCRTPQLTVAVASALVAAVALAEARMPTVPELVRAMVVDSPE